jgi:hypothetical protein
MLDLIKELQSDVKFSNNLAIACGGNHKFIFMGLRGETITGLIRINLKDKFTLMSVHWDRYGLPIDIQKYPSKYYIRLVVRE